MKNKHRRQNRTKDTSPRVQEQRKRILKNRGAMLDRMAASMADKLMQLNSYAMHALTNAENTLDGTSIINSVVEDFVQGASPQAFFDRYGMTLNEETKSFLRNQLYASWRKMPLNLKNATPYDELEREILAAIDDKDFDGGDVNVLRWVETAKSNLRKKYGEERFKLLFGKYDDVKEAERLVSLISKEAKKISGERQLREAEAAIGSLEKKLEEENRNFQEVAGMSHDAFVEHLVASGKDLPTPPPVTAMNVEVCAMSMTQFTIRLMKRLGDEGEEMFGSELFETYKDNMSARKHSRAFLAALERLGIQKTEEKEILEFLRIWAKNAYARLEVGHKIAASLCLTDVPEGMAAAPWEAWSLVVPDGLLGVLARVWVLGLTPVLCIARDGTAHTLTRVEGDMVRSLIHGASLALSDPEEFRKERHHAPSSRSSKKHEDPDLTQARFMLSASVEIDLREHVAVALDDEHQGRKHSSPKVQFLVRGHWAMQVHGVGRALRKKIWRKPFWKGPREGAVLLRSHKVDEA